MEHRVKSWLRPGYLTLTAKADDRRMEFDCKNQTIVQKETPVDVLFIGDSITQMWELPAYFHESGLRIINRGIGGDRTWSLLHRFRADAVQLKPRLTVLMDGINDAWDLEYDNWKQESGRPLDEILNEALGNMEKVVQISQEAGMDLVLCSILPTCMNWTNRERDRQEYARLYNEGLRKLAAGMQIRFVDYYPEFVDEDGYSMRRELTTEGIHPNVFGYDIMAALLKEKVNILRA